MAKFNDNNWGDDDPGPDTDPISDIFDSTDEDNNDNETEPVDKANYVEPGSGDSFAGEDPSVWEAEGNPEKPEAQTDQATSPVEIDSQSATVPDGGGTFGRNDDPDAKENVADEETGDDEDDTARPEQTSVDIDEDVKEYIEVDDYFDEVSFNSHLEAIESLKDKINEAFGAARIKGPESRFLKDLFGIEIDETDGHNVITEKYNISTNPLDIKFGSIPYSINFNSFTPSVLELMDYVIDAIKDELVDDAFIYPDLEDEEGYFEDDLSNIIGSGDEYEMPGLAEIVGSLDINDYIGDASLNSLLQEFQYVDAEEDNDLL